MIDQMKANFFREYDDKRIATFVMLNVSDSDEFDTWFTNFVESHMEYGLSDEEVYVEYERTWRPDHEMDDIRGLWYN